jgi:hypothetical protein
MECGEKSPLFVPILKLRQVKAATSRSTPYLASSFIRGPSLKPGPHIHDLIKLTVALAARFVVACQAARAGCAAEAEAAQASSLC